MKRKINILKIGICVLVLGTALFIAGRYLGKYMLYREYKYPNEDFYGKELYSEILHDCSSYESEVGHMLMEKAIAVSEYTGTEQDSENEMGDVGALSKYYYFYSPDAVSQKVTLEFITCKISGDEGHVWVASTIVCYNESGKTASGGGRDMLDLWRIEKTGDNWYVTEVTHSP